jgi:hypothetical protein
MHQQILHNLPVLLNMLFANTHRLWHLEPSFKLEQLHPILSGFYGFIGFIRP